MSTFLFSWNPHNWEWKSQISDLQNMEQGLCVTHRWSTGSRKKDIQVGDQFILVKLGSLDKCNKGIIGLGTINSNIYNDCHWNEEKKQQGRTATFVDLKFNHLSDSPLITLNELEAKYSEVNWTPQSNGISINDQIYSEVLSTISNSITELEKKIMQDLQLSTTEKSQLIKARVGQGKFREKLQNYWLNQCCISNLNISELLIASHIKPWALSNNRERLDEFNGLLLSPNLDKLFDKGFISFSNSGKIIFSKKIISQIDNLGLNQNMRFKINDKHQDYLKFHRENIFKE